MTTAFWCVLIAGCMPFIVVGIAKWDKRYDNNTPLIGMNIALLGTVCPHLDLTLLVIFTLLTVEVLEPF